MFFKIIVGSAMAAILGTGFVPAPTPREHTGEHTVRAIHAERASVVLEVPPPARAKASHAYQSKTVRLLRMIPVKPHRGTYHTGKLAGSHVSSHYAWYLGVSRTIPKKLSVDWNERITRLWERKYDRADITVVHDTGSMLVAEYKRLDPGRTTLVKYQSHASKEARRIYKSLDWDEVGRLYFRDPHTKRVDQQKLALLKRISKRIDGRMLIAYMMTELLPTSGKFGREYLDFLLRNAGSRYVESLPALHDDLTSFGPFQFTSHAVGVYYEGSVLRVGGASKMGRALPRSLWIPDSVALLRGDDHVRAAELFAIHNIANLIRQLDEQQMTLFEQGVRKNPMMLVQFIATAHNKPTVAYRAALKWIDAKKRQNYQASCPEHSREYAQKTKTNFLVLVIDTVL